MQSPRQWRLPLWLILLFFVCCAPAKAEEGWQPVDAGLSIGRFVADLSGEVRLEISVVKIDPNKYRLKLLCASELGSKGSSAKEWAQRFGLVAAINAGMYQKDNATSVGYMKNFQHVNNPSRNRYKTALAFNRIDSTVPPIQIIDLECQDFAKLASKYQSLFQGIRMISCEGRNVWKQQPDKWKTAAVGIDIDGNVLFIFCETPASVHDLINALLALPISIKNAMYLEGGPPASLYVARGEFELDLSGADSFVAAGAIPNVLGVVGHGAWSEEQRARIKK